MGVFRLNKVGIFLGVIVLFLLGFSLGIFIGKKTINDSKNQDDNNIFSFLFDNKNKELFKKDYVKVFSTKKNSFFDIR